MAVVEDQAETREGISFLINHTAGFECRHVYPTAEVALENIGIDPPASRFSTSVCRDLTALRPFGFFRNAIPGSRRLC